MAIVKYDSQRGRIVMEKKINQNPRNGLTLRMIRAANKRVGTPVNNSGSIRVLVPPKFVNVKQGGQLRKGSKWKVKDFEVPTGTVKHRIQEVLVFMKDPKADGPFSSPNTNIMVSCSCEAFMYMSEYALTHYGASFIKHSNGQPPLVTNPSLIPFSCKHIEGVLREIQNRGL